MKFNLLSYFIFECNSNLFFVLNPAILLLSYSILRRDERKQMEESYRVRGAGINKAPQKEVIKNPTRVIPDQPGMY